MFLFRADIVLVLLAITTFGAAAVVVFMTSFNNKKLLYGSYSEDLLEHARKRTELVIDAGAAKISEMIRDARIFNANLRRTGRESINEVVSNNRGELDALTKDLRAKVFASIQDSIEHNNEKIAESLTRFQSMTDAHLDELRSVISQRFKESQKSFDEAIQVELSDARESIEKFKERRLDEVRETLKKGVPIALKQIVNTSLPESIHNDLILKALNNAYDEISATRR